MPDRLLTEKDVARRLQVSPRTVARIKADGELRHVRISDRAVRFRPEDVDDYIVNRTRRNLNGA